MKMIHYKTFGGKIISIFEIRKDFQDRFGASWHAYVSVHGAKPHWCPLCFTRYGRPYIRIAKDKIYLEDFGSMIA